MLQRSRISFAAQQDLRARTIAAGPVRFRRPRRRPPEPIAPVAPASFPPKTWPLRPMLHRRPPFDQTRSDLCCTASEAGGADLAEDRHGPVPSPAMSTTTVPAERALRAVSPAMFTSRATGRDPRADERAGSHATPPPPRSCSRGGRNGRTRAARAPGIDDHGDCGGERPVLRMGATAQSPLRERERTQPARFVAACAPKQRFFLRRLPTSARFPRVRRAGATLDA